MNTKIQDSGKREAKPQSGVLNAGDPTTKKIPNIQSEISIFTRQMGAISVLSANLPAAVSELAAAQFHALKTFEDQKCSVTTEGTIRRVSIPYLMHRDWKKLRENYEHYVLSGQLLPRSLLVALVSQFDAYIGRLFRAVAIRKPEILSGSERQITFQSLGKFSTLDEAREYFLEKEIESLLRSSHAEQFKILERLFDVPLTKDLDAWPTFIELTERRNLFVHTDGVVSSQYIATCKAQGCHIEDGVKEGTRLQVSATYLKTAQECLYEVGVKLAHVLWRKLFPGERNEADSSYVAISYELITSGQYQLALRLLDFACSMKKFSSESYKLMFVVNRAQAYKWSGNDSRCREIMSSEDWSAKSDNFKLANAVLANNWDEAVAIMKRIGTSGPVTQPDYRDWPLFRGLRKEAGFLAAYESIFGVAFSVASEVESDEIKGDNQSSSHLAS